MMETPIQRNPINQIQDEIHLGPGNMDPTPFSRDAGAFYRRPMKTTIVVSVELTVPSRWYLSTRRALSSPAIHIHYLIDVSIGHLNLY
jgi:hypothetical protein